MKHVKHATADHPVHELIAQRWSPYIFSNASVSPEELSSLFEAARWAASSYNEQPWRYLVATRDDPAEFERLLSCLTEGNQAWARHAPALALGIVARRFTRNEKPNRTADHDLGLASANLTLEATARGLCVHQMAGILPERIRELYHIPEGYDAVTALAIGYPGNPESQPELGARDEKARSRRPLSQFVFTGKWEQPWARE